LPPVDMDVLLDHRDELGEGPVWSTREQRLYWVDIVGEEVQRAALDGSDHQVWTTPGKVGSAVPARDGSMVLALRNGLGRLDLKTGLVQDLLTLEDDRPAQRFNDGKCDPQGRFWFGSMHDLETDPVGALYRYDGSGSCTQMLTGVTTSNGLGWSPDGATFYYTDSIARQINAFDFRDDGSISDRRIFAQDPAEYVPDGLTVDSEGFVWSAKWDGNRLVRYAPDGRVDRVVPMPVRRPTSCAFAGPELRTLVVTSAAWGLPALSPEGLDGSVFLLDVGVPGLASTEFAG
jgi:L-arabinonolactonase